MIRKVMVGLCAVVLLAACSSSGNNNASGKHRSAGGGHKTASSTSSAHSHLPACHGSRISGRTRPFVSVRPTKGPVGTVVTLKGKGFTGGCWPYTNPQGVWFDLLGNKGAPAGCLFAAVFNGVATVKNGHLLTEVKIPATGTCISDTKKPARTPKLPPGNYLVTLTCSSCPVGHFTVTKKGGG